MPRLNVFSGSEDKKKEEDGGSSWFPKIEIQIPMFSGDEDRKSSDEENQIMKGAGENLLFGLPPFVVLFRATHNAHNNLLCLVLCDLKYYPQKIGPVVPPAHLLMMTLIQGGGRGVRETGGDKGRSQVLTALNLMKMP